MVDMTPRRTITMKWSFNPAVSFGFWSYGKGTQAA
jgi:hypothetical protein